MVPLVPLEHEFLKTKHNVPWIDPMKGIAMIGVILEHWTDTVPHQSPITLVQQLVALFGFGGSLVHQFFLLSGVGLAIGYFSHGVTSWTSWSKRRVAKVLVPYWVVIVVTFFSLNALHHFAPERNPEAYSSGTLLAYLTLVRNFVPSSYSMNTSLWFMPVIIGLYVSFPFLIRFLDRRGSAQFVGLALTLTFGSIAVSLACGYPKSHQASIFLFHVAPFATGILLAYGICRHSFQMDRLARWPTCLAGIALIGTSAALVNAVSWGDMVNDLLTTIGAFFILTSLFFVMQHLQLKRCSHFLTLFGNHSYTVYLIHMPLIKYGVGPFLTGSTDQPIASSLFFIVAILSVPVFLALAIAIGKPLSALSTLVSRRLFR